MSESRRIHKRKQSFPMKLEETSPKERHCFSTENLETRLDENDVEAFITLTSARNCLTLLSNRRHMNAVCRHLFRLQRGLKLLFSALCANPILLNSFQKSVYKRWLLKESCKRLNLRSLLLVCETLLDLKKIDSSKKGETGGSSIVYKNEKRYPINTVEGLFFILLPYTISEIDTVTDLQKSSSFFQDSLTRLATYWNSYIRGIYASILLVEDEKDHVFKYLVTITKMMPCIQPGQVVAGIRTLDEENKTGVKLSEEKAYLVDIIFQN